jgi:hypothetical protein
MKGRGQNVAQLDARRGAHRDSDNAHYETSVASPGNGPAIGVLRDDMKVQFLSKSARSLCPQKRPFAALPRNDAMGHWRPNASQQNWQLARPNVRGSIALSPPAKLEQSRGICARRLCAVFPDQVQHKKALQSPWLPNSIPSYR